MPRTKTKTKRAVPALDERPGKPALPTLQKSPTGIQGLDEITKGGLPKGRSTLVCGAAGSGKTLLAATFLVNGARLYGEPGVLMTFEEDGAEIAANVASLGFDFHKLVDNKKLIVDHVRVERSEIEETGEYDLEGLFIRLDYAMRSIGAKRVVLDSIEALFAGLSNDGLLRAELRRLFRWLKEKGVTSVITGERADGRLTRHGIEEYVSDAVILLDHRVLDQTSTRRLRVVKYRGSDHGTNEYPFLIDDSGIGIMPVSSLGLDHPALEDRLSSGVDSLDAMLGSRGFYRGSTVLVSGTSGSGKTSFAAHFAHAACRRGERCLFFLMEESPQQMVRNMRSVGIELASSVDSGLLRFYAARPSRFGLEQHLVEMHRAVRDFEPALVVIDPLTSMLSAGAEDDVRIMLVRMIDYLKTEKVTALFTSLSSLLGGPSSETGISSLADAWVDLRLIEAGAKLRRSIVIYKSRGMDHSSRIHEFQLGGDGLVIKEGE